MRRTAAAVIATAGLLALPAAALGATITPNSTTDDFNTMPQPGPLPDVCSLREAIQNAVTNTAANGCATAGDAGTDMILLTAPVLDTYTISIGANGNETNAEDDFDVGGGGPIVIRGTDTQQIDTISTDRIFDVKAGAALTLENLIVHGGDVTGALTQDARRGGNIRANTSSGSLTLNDAIVRFGKAEGGGGIYAADGNQLSIVDSRIENNNASLIGGGLLALGGPGNLTVQITRSRVRDNFASSTANGSGLVVGGGISFAGQQLTVTDSEITGNAADHEGSMSGDGATGGGIRTSSNTIVRRSLIAENNARADNGAEEKGGGILAEGGDASETVRVVDSAFHDNVAGNSINDGEGGAITTKRDGDLGNDIGVSLTHVTFSTSNQTSAVTGGDLVQTGTGADTGTITLRASILPGFAGLANNPCAGSGVVSAGFNIAQQNDPQCNFGASDSTSDAATGVLGATPADNGGFTDSFALVPGGRAANFVPAAECGPAEGTDQRGYPRPLPVGGACDAGAYELHTCPEDGTVRNGLFVACLMPTMTAPPVTAPVPAGKKCKKPKKKRKKAGAAAKKNPKGCKKKKRKKK